MTRRLLVLLFMAAVSATAASAAGGGPAPKVGGCRVFPANNPWNQPVDKLPVASNSDAIVRAIGADEGMHADFGSGKYAGGPIGIPYTTVGRGQKRVRVKFDYSDESDKGPYPIPRGAPIEGGPGPAGRAERRRPGLGWRPACDRGRPLALQAVRAVRGLPDERRNVVEGRLGR